jgi:hypothetical protein
VARNLIGSTFGAKQCGADLWPIAVRDYQPISASHEANDRRCRTPRIRQLLRNRSFFSSPDQGITAYGDEHGLHDFSSQ